MKLKLFPGEYAVCQPRVLADVPIEDEFWFLGKTDEEISLVCRAESVPDDAAKSEADWRMFRVEGVLDFSLVGILSRLTGVLAEAGIPVFAVSTFNTDYLLVKKDRLTDAVAALSAAGYSVDRGDV